MKQLFVWLQSPDNRLVRVGELAITDPDSSGRFESEFEYAPSWLQQDRAFSIDPASLPLERRRFRADLLHPPLAVFDDALPDDWGRRLLTTLLKRERIKPTSAEMLLRMRGGGTGALVFVEHSELPPAVVHTLQTKSLAALLSAAAKFEAGDLPSDDDFRKLLDGTSRAGGARPKALVHDAQGEWIAKFPSLTRDGVHDVVGLEANCLMLAGKAGLDVPESRLQTIGRRRVLLVRRFDTTALGGRIHMVSMRTLCKERPGRFVTSYSELAGIIDKYSSAPAVDSAALFRLMCFNAAIGNVDDHLKNVWMLARPEGYRLAPAFDLVPDITGRGEHTLSFQYGMTCPTRRELLAVAVTWEVLDANAIVSQVIEAAAKFTASARDLEIKENDSFKMICNDIDCRLKLLS